MINKIFSFLIISSLVLLPLVASAQSASGEISFGGLHLVTLGEETCTCGGNSHWILDYKTKSLLMVYFQAGQSRLFTNYNTRATYQLGTYSAGGQSCRILVGNSCVDIVNMGTYGMMPGTGTSISKNSPLFQEYKPAPNQNSYFAQQYNKKF